MRQKAVECIEPVVDIPEGVSIVAMDLQDEAEEQLVQMVRMDQNDIEECLTVGRTSPSCPSPMGTWDNGRLALSL